MLRTNISEMWAFSFILDKGRGDIFGGLQKWRADYCPISAFLEKGFPNRFYSRRKNYEAAPSIMLLTCITFKLAMGKWPWRLCSHCLKSNAFAVQTMKSQSSSPLLANSGVIYEWCCQDATRTVGAKTTFNQRNTRYRIREILSLTLTMKSVCRFYKIFAENHLWYILIIDVNFSFLSTWFHIF